MLLPDFGAPGPLFTRTQEPAKEWTELCCTLVDAWRARSEIDRLEYRKARTQEIAEELNAVPAASTLVTHLHAKHAKRHARCRLHGNRCATWF